MTTNGKAATNGRRRTAESLAADVGLGRLDVARLIEDALR